MDIKLSSSVPGSPFPDLPMFPAQAGETLTAVGESERLLRKRAKKARVKERLRERRNAAISGDRISPAQTSSPSRSVTSSFDKNNIGGSNPPSSGVVDSNSKSADSSLVTYDVHVFIARLKDALRTVPGEEVRLRVQDFSVSSAAFWYSCKTTAVKKQLTGGGGLDRWATELLKRFSESKEVARKKYEAVRFTLDDVWDRTDPAVYVETVSRHGKNLGVRDNHSHLMQAYTGIHPALLLDLPPLQYFDRKATLVQAMDAKLHIWRQELANQRSELLVTEQGLAIRGRATARRHSSQRSLSFQNEWHPYDFDSRRAPPDYLGRHRVTSIDYSPPRYLGTHRIVPCYSRDLSNDDRYYRPSYHWESD